ncbi:MAG: hypothetical protein HY080_13005 [Gammaproteobacteria bacterium]|nr:hypothetical protein [Gammaproteobacteria bacterium]
MAFVIKNRVGKYEWIKHTTISDIVRKTGFDACTDRNAPFKAAEKYLNNHVIDHSRSHDHIDRLVEVITPIYLNKVEDFTHKAVLYYSPKAQSTFHKKNPQKYREKPKWEFDQLTEVKIPGLLASDDFKFYKYK